MSEFKFVKPRCTRYPTNIAEEVDGGWELAVWLQVIDFLLSICDSPYCTENIDSGFKLPKQMKNKSWIYEHICPSEAYANVIKLLFFTQQFELIGPAPVYFVEVVLPKVLSWWEHGRTRLVIR